MKEEINNYEYFPFQIPSLNYPAVAEAALMEGPEWSRACAPYIV